MRQFKTRAEESAYWGTRGLHDNAMKLPAEQANAYCAGYNQPDKPISEDDPLFPYWAAGCDNAKMACPH